MASRVEMSEKDILAIANLPPLGNETLNLLQEVLSKLGIFVAFVINSSHPVLFITAAVLAGCLFPLAPSHP